MSGKCNKITWANTHGISFFAVICTVQCERGRETKYHKLGIVLRSPIAQPHHVLEHYVLHFQCCVPETKISEKHSSYTFDRYILKLKPWRHALENIKAGKLRDRGQSSRKSSHNNLPNTSCLMFSHITFVKTVLLEKQVCRSD